MVLTRYPDGITGKSFFQKDAPGFAPDWLRTERMWSEHASATIDYFICDDVESLLYLINLGTIPLHIWGSRGHLGSSAPTGASSIWTRRARPSPTWSPSPSRSARCATKSSSRLPQDLRLHRPARDAPARPRVHLRAVPELRAAARGDGRGGRARISTVARPLRNRGGKVYIDLGQNAHGQTNVAPYSLRPLPGAPASCPLEWREVTPRLDPARFTLKTLPVRFDKMADPLTPVLGDGIDMAAALERIEVRLSAAPGAGGRTRGRSRPPRA